MAFDVEGFIGSMGKTNVVPFGKYRGQPLEVLRHDPEYVQWALDNGVVSETKYRAVYVFLTGAAGESHDTPEHNRYQVMFLEPDFAGEVFDRRYPNVRGRVVMDRRRSDFFRLNPSPEWKGIEPRTLGYNTEYWARETARCSDLSDYQKDSLAGHQKDLRDYRIYKEQLAAWTSWREGEVDYPVEAYELPEVEVQFEVKAMDYGGRVRGGSADVVMACAGHQSRVEIKPSMGDDFPAVLRQMQSSYCDILYLGGYNGVGSTLQQVKKLFALSKILVLEHQ